MFNIAQNLLKTTVKDNFLPERFLVFHPKNSFCCKHCHIGFLEGGLPGPYIYRPRWLPPPSWKRSHSQSNMSARGPFRPKASGAPFLQGGGVEAFDTGLPPKQRQLSFAKPIQSWRTWSCLFPPPQLEAERFWVTLLCVVVIVLDRTQSPVGHLRSEAVADPGGPGGRALLAPKISSKLCSFQAILRENPQFWANFRLRAPLGVQTLLPPDQILDPRLWGPLTNLLHRLNPRTDKKYSVLISACYLYALCVCIQTWDQISQNFQKWSHFLRKEAITYAC